MVVASEKMRMAEKIQTDTTLCSGVSSGLLEHDALRADLRRLVMGTGLAPTELACRAGLSPSSLNDTSARHVLSIRTLSRLAEITGGYLDPSPPNRVVGKVIDEFPPSGLADVPVLGHARGDHDGMFIDNGLVDSYAPRLHLLTGAQHQCRAVPANQ